MTLRYDPDGRPAGLDWSAISAQCPQDPSVWSKDSLVKTNRPGSRLPDETETLIVRFHLEGLTGTEIASRLDVSVPTVSAVLDRHEIRENRGRGVRSRTPDNVAREVVRLYLEEGMSGAQIYTRTGVRHATVYKILRRNGIEPRTKGGKTRGVAA